MNFGDSNDYVFDDGFDDLNNDDDNFGDEDNFGEEMNVKKE